MDKIEDELTKEEKKFLDQMFGNRGFLKRPEDKIYGPQSKDETFGDTFSSYVLRGPPEVRDDDVTHGVFNYAWGFLSYDPIDPVNLDGFTEYLLSKALCQGKGTKLENEFRALLLELDRSMESNSPMGGEHYAFTQFLSII